MQLHYDVIM